jgi:hypothetical protein
MLVVLGRGGTGLPGAVRRRRACSTTRVPAGGPRRSRPVGRVPVGTALVPARLARPVP